MRTGLFKIISLALLIGALVNIAICWWFAAFDMRWISVPVMTTKGAYPAPPPASWASDPFVERLDTRWTTTIVCDPPMTQFQTGWPCRALSWTIAETDRSLSDKRFNAGAAINGQGNVVTSTGPIPPPPDLGLLDDGLPHEWLHAAIKYVGRRPPSYDMFPRRLPIRPIALGFLANTALFALPIALPLVLFKWFQQRRRAQESRCLNCGYPRANLSNHHPCPECGSPAPASRPASPPSAS